MDVQSGAGMNLPKYWPILEIIVWSATVFGSLASAIVRRRASGAWKILQELLNADVRVWFNEVEAFSAVSSVKTALNTSELDGTYRR